MLASGAMLIALATPLDRELIAPFYDAQARSFLLGQARALETLGHSGLKWWPGRLRYCSLPWLR